MHEWSLTEYTKQLLGVNTCFALLWHNILCRTKTPLTTDQWSRRPIVNMFVITVQRVVSFCHGLLRWPSTWAHVWVCSLMCCSGVSDRDVDCDGHVVTRPLLMKLWLSKCEIWVTTRLVRRDLFAVEATLCLRQPCGDLLWIRWKRNMWWFTTIDYNDISTAWWREFGSGDRCGV